MRSRFLFPLAILLALALAVPSFSQTEDELVARFIKKTEKRHKKKVGFIVVEGSYGKLRDNTDYNHYTQAVTPLISSVDGSRSALDGVYRSKEFNLGFGMMASPKATITLDFTYWLKMGNSVTGDFVLSAVDPDNPGVQYDFELNSEVQVYGMGTEMSYFLLNPPDQDGIMRNIALKVNVGGGYYLAGWKLWDGCPGYNLNTEDIDHIEGKLKGSSFGFTAGAGFEYPVPLGGLVVEGGAKYVYLNFGNMKWYNDRNEEVIIPRNESADRAELDFSGPRVQFGLKRYFSW